MARTNYQQLRKQKEAVRKNRRQEKLERRVQKGPVESAAATAAPAVNDPAAPEGNPVE